MRIVLSSRGSRGDVMPIVEIATELARRGHGVTLTVPRTFEAEVRARGLSTVLSEEDSHAVMDGLGAGWTAARRALDWFARDLESQIDRLLELTSGADALVTSVNEMGAPTVAEALGVPSFRVAYAPILAGDQPPPLLPWQWLPRAGNRAMWSALNGAVGLLLRRFLGPARARLGLPPVTDTADYFALRSHTLLAISPTLGPPSARWRHPHTYTGCCFGGEEAAPLGPELEEFLAAGPPPVYVGFGSVTVEDPEELTGLALAAARRAGCRLLLGSGWTGLGGRSLPEGAFAVGDVAHAALFPRVAGVAHHGGSGTTHVAASAGVPQLVMPQLADQHYWGQRVWALGLGPRPVPPRRLTVEGLATALRALASPGAASARARLLAGRVACGPPCVRAAADVVASDEARRPADLEPASAGGLRGRRPRPARAEVCMTIRSQ